MDKDYIWYFSFPMRKGFLDDDYYFYPDGRILHSYDRTQNKLNIEEFVSAESISEEKRRVMLEACPLDKYEIIKQTLRL